MAECVITEDGPANETPLPAGLTGLRLSPCDLEELTRQGFVARELRNGRELFKLRWRCRGRQFVRYIGNDRDRAEQVRAALDRLQHANRIIHAVQRLLGETRKRLLNAKTFLACHAESHGLRYNGYRIRRPTTSRGQEGGPEPLSRSEVVAIL